MANESSKKFSDELKALRAEFNDIAEKAKKVSAELTSAIYKQEAKELREENDAVVKEFAVPGDLESIGNRDVTVLINRSKDMGHGFKSPAGKTVEAVTKLRRVASFNYDISVSAALFEKGGTKGLNLSDYDRLEKALEKTEANDKAIGAALRDIMIANTPDKATDRARHYVIVTDGSITDSTEYAVQMIEATLLYNKKATFDFITIGAGGGNLSEVELKTSHALAADRVSFHKVEKADDMWDALAGVLKTRIAAAPYVAPKPQPVPPTNTATATPTP